MSRLRHALALSVSLFAVAPASAQTDAANPDGCVFFGHKGNYLDFYVANICSSKVVNVSWWDDGVGFREKHALTLQPKARVDIKLKGEPVWAACWHPKKVVWRKQNEPVCR